MTDLAVRNQNVGHVLTEAIVIKPMKLGSNITEVEAVDSDGVPYIQQIENDIMAKPGDRVNVSQWAHVDSYVRQGYIHLVTPTIAAAIEEQDKRQNDNRNQGNRPGNQNRNGGK